MPLYFLFSYGPLFGYGVCGTLWRFGIIVSVATLAEISIAIFCDLIIGNPMATSFVVDNLLRFAVSVIALVAGYFISKYGENKRLQKIVIN